MEIFYNKENLSSTNALHHSYAYNYFSGFQESRQAFVYGFA